FGIAALTTALSSMRLGQKVALFNSAYYTAEGAASERFAMIDKAVAEAYAEADGDITDAVLSHVSGLDFDTSTDSGSDTIEISFETWSGDIGIFTTLALDIADKDSLRITEWKEIQ
ncbi:MAG: hypothetical protein PHO15_09235, partial [Eubacteriales bacterium]|nr:hypothetical protein [Eubacteriales bacterium]